MLIRRNDWGVRVESPNPTPTPTAAGELMVRAVASFPTRTTIGVRVARKWGRGDYVADVTRSFSHQTRGIDRRCFVMPARRRLQRLRPVVAFLAVLRCCFFSSLLTIRSGGGWGRVERSIGCPHGIPLAVQQSHRGWR